MLKFDADFFQPQIRDGFFVDATMKSMWAADMEVVARISAICEKYNIQWFAAYGTLLGAIRHEGFVPWDDDMDMWVLREGYNKLMEVLPKELPEGYLVQSCFSKDGYNQFHTCINNGRGVSIRPEWLEEYHGCPFSVAVDIFPLDYLPRNEGEAAIQKNLIEMVGRGAALADGIKDNRYNEEELKTAFAELMEIKDYIEGFCSYQFNMQYIEDGNWRMVASDFWKCGNYIAMLYGEEDADYLVDYMDYDKCGKKHKKEYFAEAYSADFENIMIPVPCGYDEVLKVVYGNYMVPVKNWGGHEYPFYARQLRELRKIVKEKEKAADPNWKDTSDTENIFPENWQEMIQGKKVVLFEDGIPLYTEYEEAALQKLEDVLATFKENKDKIILWWRPQRQIREALKLLSQELVERYDRIVADYRAETWGIYDLSLEEDRAVEKSDAYYGERNALVNRIKGTKPIMIEAIT